MLRIIMYIYNDNVMNEYKFLSSFNSSIEEAQFQGPRRKPTKIFSKNHNMNLPVLLVGAVQRAIKLFELVATWAKSQNCQKYGTDGREKITKMLAMTFTIFHHLSSIYSEFCVLFINRFPLTMFICISNNIMYCIYVIISLKSSIIIQYSDNTTYVYVYIRLYKVYHCVSVCIPHRDQAHFLSGPGLCTGL